MLWRAWLYWELDRWPGQEPWSLPTTWWRIDARPAAAPARTCRGQSEPERPGREQRILL